MLTFKKREVYHTFGMELVEEKTMGLRCRLTVSRRFHGEIRLLCGLISWLILALATSAASESGQSTLVIVTPYPPEMTDTFRRAFQKRHPEADVQILRKKTGAAIKYLEKTAGRNTTDLVWASSPDAFELLKSKKLLERYRPRAAGIPEHLGSYPVNDPDGYFTGFAGSGFGLMFNTRYLNAKGLSPPGTWRDLIRPEYFGHIVMSSPSRSGTTHLIVESMLQQFGWDDGWKLIKQIAGNAGEITRKSYDVPVSVRDGVYGVGLVIDYYGLSARARRYPVEFVYPDKPMILPASIAIVEHAPNRPMAEKFIEFLLSAESQTLLLGKDVCRLPVRPGVYRSASDAFPNPHRDKRLQDTLPFDVALSKQRYNLVNALFDDMVTFNHQALQSALQAIHRAEALQAKSPNVLARARIDSARERIASVPINEARSRNPDFRAIFKRKRKKKADKIDARQKAIEDAWEKVIVASYQRAKTLAEQAIGLIENGVGLGN